MRIQNALAIAMLAAIGGSANATPPPSVGITFTDPIQTYLGVAQTFTFGGTITDLNAPTPYTIDSDSSVPDIANLSLNVTSLTSSTAVTDAALPIVLDSGDGYSYTSPDLFSVTMPAGFDYGWTALQPAFTIANGTTLEEDTFTTQIVNGTPEPGTVALLLSSGLGGSALILRRRRAK